MRGLLTVRNLRSPTMASIAMSGLLCGCASAPARSAPDLLAFEPGDAPAASAPAVVKVDLASPISVICAYPGGRAVLERALPGLTTRPEYGFFKEMTLVQLRPLSRGRISKADLARVGADLAKLQAARADTPPAKTLATRD